MYDTCQSLPACLSVSDPVGTPAAGISRTTSEDAAGAGDSSADWARKASTAPHLENTGQFVFFAVFPELSKTCVCALMITCVSHVC